MNSDTPKTDGKLGLAGYFGDKDEVVEANFCRQLERELACSKRNEACCHCGSLMSQHGMGDGHSPVPMPEECPYASKLASAAARIEKLEGALRKIRGTTMSHVLTTEHGFTRCRVLAHEALNPEETKGGGQ